MNESKKFIEQQDKQTELVLNLLDNKVEKEITEKVQVNMSWIFVIGYWVFACWNRKTNGKFVNFRNFYSAIFFTVLTWFASDFIGGEIKKLYLYIIRNYLPRYYKFITRAVSVVRYGVAVEPEKKKEEEEIKIENIQDQMPFDENAYYGVGPGYGNYEEYDTKQ